MRKIPDTTGLDGYGETPGETGSAPTALTGKAFYQDLIRKANTVPLAYVFKHYGLHLNEINRKTTCPFKTHKGGRESSASFYFYPDTNSYCCYGCRLGSFGCDFVAAMDGITKSQAAYKIISLFNGYVDDDDGLDRNDFTEKLEIMLDFSNAIREFRQSHFDEKSFEFAEHICSVYDTLNMKHKTLNNEALRRVVDELKEKINSYTPCHK